MSAENRIKVVVLCSGGMDSVAALYDAAEIHEVTAAISFHYGAKHNDREIPFAKWHADHLGIPHITVPLAFIGEQFESDLLQKGGEIPKGHYEEETMKKTVVPFRNGIMLSIAGGFAESKGAHGLVIAAHSGDHAIYPDCREDFLSAMVQVHGAQLLRYKGILNIHGVDRRVVFQGVHMLMGSDLAQPWAAGETRESKMVFIGKDLPREALEKGLTHSVA